jgi:hypothetical protein
MVAFYYRCEGNNPNPACQHAKRCADTTHGFVGVICILLVLITSNVHNSSKHQKRRRASAASHPQLLKFWKFEIFNKQS